MHIDYGAPTDTTADVASTVAIPTVGDIVKINITGEAISTLEYVFDFGEVIRDNYRNVADNADVTIATTTNATAVKGNYTVSGLETIYGGIVTACNDDYQVSFANDIWTSSAVNNKYLDEAKNVYVIEVGGRNTVIDTGSYRDFSYFEGLYTDGVSKIYSIDGTTTKVEAGEAKAAYGDHVYVREYDGDIIDVVIVKGLVDDVEADTAATYKLTGIELDATASGVAATDLVDGDITVTRESATKFVVEGNFKNYTSNAWTTVDFGVLPWPAGEENGHFAPLTLVIEGAEDLELLTRLENGGGSAAGRTFTREVEGVTYTVEIINTGI